MKLFKTHILSIFIVMCFWPMGQAEAQVLKGFGKKLEKKLEQRLERKVDRQVDKVIDKADKKTDEPIDDLLNNPKGKKKNAKDSKESKNVNNSKSPAGSKSSNNFETIEARPDQTLTLIGSNCNDFSWFSKGAQLVYEGLDEKGNVEGGMEMKITNLTSKGSATVAEVSAVLSSPHYDDLAYQMNYICDGDKIYMDISSMMKAMMGNDENLKSDAAQNVLKNMEFDFDNGFASFPKKMYPGMKLDDQKFSFKTKTMNTEMGFDAVVSDRQVVAIETIKTPAGTFECVKIRSVTNSTVKVMGINQKSPPSMEYVWIAPKIGMVKQELYQDGKLSTSLHLKKFKL